MSNVKANTKKSKRYKYTWLWYILTRRVKWYLFENKYIYTWKNHLLKQRKDQIRRVSEICVVRVTRPNELFRKKIFGISFGDEEIWTFHSVYIKSIKYLLTETGKLHTFGFTLSICFFFLRIHKNYNNTVDLHVMHLLDHLRDGAKVVSTDGNVFSAAQNSTLRKPTPKSKKRLSTTGVPGGGANSREALIKKRDKSICHASWGWFVYII